MKDNEILKMLGLDDRTITIGLNDEYTQMILEKKIDSYLKNVDEENKKEKMVSYLKEEHEKYIEKEKYLNTFNDSYVYGKIKDKLIRDGFIYRCPFCLDVSNQYGRCKKGKEKS